MDSRQRLDASAEAADKFGWILGSAQRVLGDGLNAGQCVLDAVVQLADQQLLRPLGLLALGDVDRQARITEQLAVRSQTWLGDRSHPTIDAIVAAEAELSVEARARSERAGIRVYIRLAVVGMNELIPLVAAHFGNSDAEKFQIAAVHVF